MPNAQQTKFFPADLVEVRPLNEILATLDEQAYVRRHRFGVGLLWSDTFETGGTIARLI
ncbi:MAG TPA: hypothetical protein VGJ69_02530 [Pyrinomonadaceae bacterium]|jgi:hypothetical protein